MRSGHGGSRGQGRRGAWEEEGSLTGQEGPQRNGSLHQLSCLKQSGFPNANQTSCYYHITGIFLQKTQGPASTLSPLGKFEAHSSLCNCVPAPVSAPISPANTHSYSPMHSYSADTADQTESYLPRPSPKLLLHC